MRKTIGVTLVSGLLAFAHPALGVVDDERDTRQLEMMVDLVVARPVGLVLTVVGAAAFVVSLPFTAVTGTIPAAAKSLVGGPARETFARCLGCTIAGNAGKGERR